MKRLFLICLSTLWGMSQLLADEISISDVNIQSGGTASISVNLINENTQYVSFQMDLYLPEGCSLIKSGCSLSNRFASDGQELVIGKQADGAYRLTSTSFALTPISGTSGKLLTLLISAEADFAGNSASVKNILFATSNSGKVFLGDVSFSISVAVPKFTINNFSRLYGDPNPSFTYTVTDGEMSGVPDLTTTATAASGVGTYDIVADRGSIQGEYIATNGKLTITKAPLTITANNFTMKQGDALPTFSANYSGFKNNETASVLSKQPTISCSATSASAPGTYEINIGGAEAANYAISYVKGTLTITQADPVTVTAKNYTRMYGEPNPSFEYTTSGATLQGIPQLSSDATVTSSVGTYPITVSKGSVSNYNTNFVNGALTITNAPLTITANSFTIKQGDALPSFSASYSGFKNNETSEVLSKQPSFSCAATSTSAPGTYEIIVSGAAADNYQMTYVKGTLTINERKEEQGTSSEWLSNVKPEFPKLSAADIQDGGIYYIRNAHTGQFMTGGNRWGTLLSETQDMLPQMQVRLIGTTENVKGVSMTGYRLQMANNCTFNGFNPDTQEPITDLTINAGGYLCRWNATDGNHVATDAYVAVAEAELSGIAGYVWSLTKQDNGYYCIQTAEGDPVFTDQGASYIYSKDGEAFCNGWNWNNDLPSIYWEFIPVANVPSDFSGQVSAYHEALQAYKYRKQLLELMLCVQNYLDIDDIIAVYNDNSATSSQLAQALTTLKARIQASNSILEEQVTFASPVNMTSFTLTNPAFDTRSLDGWTTVGNWQFQGAAYNNKGWTSHAKWWYEGAMTVESEPSEVLIDAFLETWTDWGASAVDGSISQTIAANVLPRGQYRLECNYIASQQSGNIEQTALTGVYLFAKSNGITLHSDALQSANEHTEHASFLFEYDGTDELELGLVLDATNCNWIAADNFKLYYYGDGGNETDEKELGMYKLNVNALPNLDYSTTATPIIDMDAIKALLATDYPVVYGQLADGTMTKNYSLSPNPGFWLSDEGMVVDYSDASATIGFAFDAHRLNVYQYPNRTHAAESYAFNCYFVNESTGYYVTLETTVEILSDNIQLNEQVSSQECSDYIALDNNYTPSALPSLDMSAIKTALGTEDYVIYGQDVAGNIVKSYTMNPAPGFWMTAEGKVTQFENSDHPAVIGYAFVNDHLEIYQKQGLIQDGDTFTFEVYFVNESTQNYSVTSITVTIGESVEKSIFKFDLFDDDMTASVTGVKKDKLSGPIIIPSKVWSNGKAYDVTEIADDAFAGTEITSVNIPENLKVIGSNAFYGCNNLTSVNIPDDITDLVIGDCAFIYCNLNDLFIPRGVKEIGSLAFFNNKELSSILISDEVSELVIGSQAFSSCYALSSLNLPMGVISIGEEAFLYCQELRSLHIPASVSWIGSGAFGGCYNVTAVEVEEGNDRYDSRNGCNAIIETKTDKLVFCCNNTIIPNEIKAVGDYAFCGLSFESIDLPEGVTIIGARAFRACLRLKSISIPNSVTTIEDCAFAHSGLTSLEVPDNVINIGADAFSDTPWYWSQPNGLVYAGKVVCSYKGEMPQEANITLKEGTLGIARKAFYYCSNLNSITIPNSVISIGSCALEGTTWYNNQPDGLVYAGKVAYIYKGDMPNDIELTLDKGTLGIAEQAFQTNHLAQITLPESIVNIGKEAFFSIRKVIAEGKIPPTIYNGSGMSRAITLVWVPVGALEAYQNAAYWENLNICETPIFVQLISLDKSSIVFNEIGETSKLSATFVPDNATLKVVSWSSSNPEVATVDLTGLVTAVGDGIAIISASTLDGTELFAECEVKVTINEELANDDTDISIFDNVLYVESSEVLVGKRFELPILLKNNVDVAGVSLTLSLPEGMTVAKDADGEVIYSFHESRAKSSKFSVYWAENADGSCGFRIMPISTMTVSGTEGTLFTVTIDIAEDMLEGDYHVVLRQNSLTVKDSEGQLSTQNLPDTQTTFSVIDVTPGDANGDGYVDLTDAIMIVYSSLGVVQSGLIEQAADVNGDKEIDLTDAIIVVYKSLGINRNQVKAREVEPE